MPAALLGPLIGGAIAGGGTIVGSALASKGANKAAQTQSDTALQAAQLQKQAQDEALAFQKQQYGENVARQQPWLEAGKGALGQLTGMPAFQAPGAAGMAEDPGYQFRLSEGQKTLERSAAARGAVLGGGAMKAAEQYGQGLGSQEYQNVYARRMGEYQLGLNQLQSLAGVGQTAGQNLGAAGLTTAGQVGGTLATGAAGQSQAMQNAAAARASGYVTGGNIWGNVASGLGQLGQDIYSQRQQPQWYGGWNPTTGNPMDLQLP